jgi:hypothetical protein
VGILERTCAKEVAHFGEWIADNAPLRDETMKPFKGVIRDWRYVEGHILGTCAYHTEAVPLDMDAMLNDRIVEGHEMHTSPVVTLENRDGYAICETKNSIYVLVDPQLTAAK